MSNVRFSNVIQIEDLMTEQLVNANAERKAWAEELEAKERAERRLRDRRQAMMERRVRCFRAIDRYTFWQRCARAAGITTIVIGVMYAVVGSWEGTAASALCIALFYWMHCGCSKEIQKCREAVEQWPQ